MTKIDSRIPEGPVAEKWTNYKAHQKLVNPANKRRRTGWYQRCEELSERR